MPATPTPDGIGRTLKEARERRGLSLRQIANTTKISVSVLEALERNNISRLPGGIFGRAFVRSYAVEVGLDPEEVIREFIAQFPLDSVTAGHPASRQVEDGAAFESQQRIASVFGRLIALSVPIVALMLYFGAGDEPSVQEPERAAAIGAEAPVTATAPAAPVMTPSDQPVPPDGGLLVGLEATGPCWVSVAVDGRPAVSREFRTGETEFLEVGREIVLRAGDAAALRLTLNGLEARPLGRAGEVVTVRLDRTNFKDYLIAP